ncbi:MAG: TetR family transcriptional regulator C-terminal domain-containing protein [Maribacter sp.]|nr:TetR family transcriptional regulator C-terminal domain-containing protein [Maribacter sp.]
MAKKTKTKEVTEDQIITAYIDYVLEHEVVPKSIFKFCKAAGITEADFYQYYGSIETLRKGIWKKFYTNTESLLLKNKDYVSFTNKDKMLTFFYSFFELLTLNRSYVLFTVQNERKLLGTMEQLKGLRKQIRHFAMALIDEGNAQKTLKITQHNPMLFAEGAWFEFLFILKFWLDDDSAGFEKTDMAIEKSINTIFDIFDNTPIDNIVDFGKFLFKEKMQ